MEFIWNTKWNSFMLKKSSGIRRFYHIEVYKKINKKQKQIDEIE